MRSNDLEEDWMNQARLAALVLTSGSVYEDGLEKVS